MDRDRIPSHASDIHHGIVRATGPHSLTQADRESIIEFINHELPVFYTPVKTYIVLGSYHQPYIRRLRATAHELNKRPLSFALVVGDTQDPSLSSASSFRVKFHVLCTVADWVVGVYEKDTKGESAELGKIAEQPYFEKAFVFPRDYHHPDATLTTKANFIAAAITTYFDDSLTDAETRTELEHLLAEAEDAGVDVTAEDFVVAIHQREAELDDAPIPTYSWPHLEDFRHFNLADRCFTWHTEDELRQKVAGLPGSNHPVWGSNQQP